jgi:uncharacterized membrane protein
MTPAITLYAVLVFLHVLAIVIWVGGMFVMHTAVRPSAVQLLEPPQRLPLMTAILGRFFTWVAWAVLVTLATGVAMIALAGGIRPLHGSVYWMFGVGVVMMLIYGHIRFAPFPRLQRAVAAKDWPAAARNLDLIRVMVSVNLAFGVVTIMIATLGRAFP